jgi:hypothetical protein
MPANWPEKAGHARVEPIAAASRYGLGNRAHQTRPVAADDG